MVSVVNGLHGHFWIHYALALTALADVMDRPRNMKELYDVIFRPTRTVLVHISIPAPVKFRTNMLTCVPPMFIPGSELNLLLSRLWSRLAEKTKYVSLALQTNFTVPKCSDLRREQASYFEIRSNGYQHGSLSAWIYCTLWETVPIPICRLTEDDSYLVVLKQSLELGSSLERGGGKKECRDERKEGVRVLGIGIIRRKSIELLHPDE